MHSLLEAQIGCCNCSQGQLHANHTILIKECRANTREWEISSMKRLKEVQQLFIVRGEIPAGVLSQ